MKELYVEGLASHDGHPHAVMMATSWPKRWTVARAGEVSSLETSIRDADPVSVGQGNTTTRKSRAGTSSHESPPREKPPVTISHLQQ
jgi:hypothetical protein